MLDALLANALQTSAPLLMVWAAFRLPPHPRLSPEREGLVWRLPF